MTSQPDAAAGPWSSARERARRFVREEPWQALGLLSVTLLTAVLALSLIDQPARCDESGTYLVFVRYGLDKILTDYSSPNNHILHTLAAKLSTKALGPSLFSLRLPALVGGILLASASYLMLRAHFGKTVGLLGTALIATCPYLVDQATNARGYSMINVAFLLLLALAAVLIRERSWLAWMLFAVIAALGLYTIPVMGFPIAIVLTWMAISGLADLPRSEWKAFAGRTLLTLVGMILLTGLLYSPALFATPSLPFQPGGIYDLDVREEALTMTRKFSQWLTVVWQYATHGMPGWLAFTTIGLAAVSAFDGRRAFGLRFFAANLIGVYTLLHLLGQRPPLWSLSFLVPVYWTAVAVGSVTLLRLLLGARTQLVQRIVLAGVIAVCLFNTAGILRIGRSISEVPWYFGYFDAEQASLYLDEEIPPTDPIVGLGREMVTIQYYQEMRGDKTPLNTLRDPIPEALRVYMIDAGFPRTELIRDELALGGFEPVEVVERFAHSTITRFERKARPVK